MKRRRTALAGIVALLCVAAIVATTDRAVGAEPTPYPWQGRLQGDSIALLGEIHDSPVLQDLRFQILKRAITAGWRPAIAMEQFDRERQSDMDAVRASHPLDADYLIDHATGRGGVRARGWDWAYYRPYIALALQYHLPLLAANLSRKDAQRIVNHGYAAVFDPATIRSLGLDHAPADLLALQENEVNEGHCHLLPATLLPGMAHAQLARDAWMAAVLRGHAASGVVLLTGDGHARRDLGVPRWLGSFRPSRVLSVGFVERGTSDPPASAFDAVVTAAPVARPDPCQELRDPRHRAQAIAPGVPRSGQVVSAHAVSAQTVGARAGSAQAVAPIPPAASWRSAVLSFARAHENNPAWGFSHSERDYELGRSLAASDHVRLDDDVMFAAAYLHDIGAFAPYARRGADHSDIGADIVGQLLAGTGFPMAKIPAVAAAIRTHMYYRKAVNAEAIYLHDADALDWLGAIGAARILGLVDPKGGQPDGPAAVKRLQNLLMQVPPGIESTAGKALLAPRVRELRRFLGELSAETSAYRVL